MSTWRRRLGGTPVRLEAVRAPAAAVISVPVAEEYVEPEQAEETGGVDEESPAPPEDPDAGADGGGGAQQESPESLEPESEAPSWEPAPSAIDEESPESLEPESEDPAREPAAEEPVVGADGGGGVDEESPAPQEDRSGVHTWEPAPIAGRYRIGEHLATSRLGRTYRARDAENEQDVEVTFLDAHVVAAATGLEERLEALRTVRHIHVLPLLDWEIAPVPYVVHGAPEMRLDRLIDSGVALSPSQTLLIGLQAAETLHTLRRQGVTHGALTPWHCCVDARGRLRLAEMGLDFLRAPPDPGGASRYDAPEAIRVAGADDDAVTGPPPADAAPSPAPAADAPPLAPAAIVPPPAPAADAAPDVAAAALAEPPPPPAPAADAPAPAAAAATPRDAAAADVYALGVTLTEAALGRPIDPAEVGLLGQAVLPPGAGTTTSRHLARLAPLLVQATAARLEQRLEADEMALALRATAEMLPPPSRLDAAFDRLSAEPGELPAAAAETEAVPRPRRDAPRNLLVRIAAAAAVVAAGALLVVFTGGADRTPTRTVPDVVGMSWTGAYDTLAASGWEVRRLEVRVPDADAGEVVGQLPGAGGLLDEGQTVKVQVSLGPPLVVIPADIVGLPLEQARLRLSEIGLALGTVERRADPTVPEGSVVAVAEPLPELPRGSPVDLVVAVAG